MQREINGRWGALLFWVRGNDGATYWQRRAAAKRYRTMVRTGVHPWFRDGRR